MLEKRVSAAYIGTGCNKSADVMDWGSNNLICFGACNSVAVYDPSSGKIIMTLSGHESDVTCVRWICGMDNELISGSSDSKVIIWSINDTSNVCNKTLTILNGHQSSILSVEGRRYDNLGTIVVSSSSDNTLRIWRNNIINEFVCEKVISTGSSFALCLDTILLPNCSHLLLAYGTDSPEVVLYSIGASESNTVYLGKSTGHEDWIRGIDMTLLKNGDILIASSSQDMMIRILRLTSVKIDVSDDSFNMKKLEIYINGTIYYLSLESVLYGHEGWVYSVNWSPAANGSPLLLSSSFDRTLIIWKPCSESGVWLEESRMGELGGDNSLGYYGAKFNPDGTSVLAHSYQGSFHLWKNSGSKWIPEFIIGGHSDSVTDLSWERNGRYVLSVSSDKSTRLHAPYHKSILSVNPFCELSRPQIHGHALHSLTTLPNLGFASCSEEKVIRVFLPSSNVVKLLNYFSDSIFENELTSGLSLPSSASITALGLSNKGNFENDKETVADQEIIVDGSITPNEDYLVQNTLWPEVMKLYGHGNDVFTVTSSHSGDVLASASKATSGDQAKIILWDTSSWNIITKLEGHQLTVTQMSFSPDDSYLLSVSRDRKWCLFKRTENNIFKFHSMSQKDKIMHTRIIWTCSWTHNGLYFATGSRDCKVIVWNTEKPVSSLTSDQGSVTALDFGPVFFENDKYILAIGHESGVILLYSWLEDWTLLYAIHEDIGHHLTVERLQFQPMPSAEEQGCKDYLHLASCSHDRSVRVFNVPII